MRTDQGRDHRRRTQRVPRGHRAGHRLDRRCSAGNVIAFGMDGYKGRESVVVVAETRSGDLDAIRAESTTGTLEVCGLPPERMVSCILEHVAEDLVG